MQTSFTQKYDGVSELKTITIQGFKILLIHGHQLVPYDDLEELSRLKREYDADIVISGHTHCLNWREHDKALFLNPGSATGAFTFSDLSFHQKANPFFHSP